MKHFLICILILVVVCGGCMQKDAVIGDYRNEGDESQFIVFENTGTFSHNNYDNNRGLFKEGNFTIKEKRLTLFYLDGQISEYFVELDGNELVPVIENTTLPKEKFRELRYAKRLEQ